MLEKHMRKNKEIWRFIGGYTSRSSGYKVSNHGNIVRVLRSGDEKPVTLIKHRGYMQVSLSKDGSSKHHRVHRLVAKAFVKGDKSLTVNHINEIKSDNYYKNLEWCTQKQNVQHSIHKRVGINNPNFKGYYCTPFGRFATKKEAILAEPVKTNVTTLSNRIKSKNFPKYSFLPVDTGKPRGLWVTPLGKFKSLPKAAKAFDKSIMNMFYRFKDKKEGYYREMSLI